MNKTGLFLRKHSSTILTVIGAGGVVATAVLSVKATPKALQLLEEEKQKKGDELTPVEVVKAAWKPYIPAAIMGASTIACIFGANYLNTRNQASLMSAYALLDSSYKEYQNKVKEINGEKEERNIKNEIANSKFKDNYKLTEGKDLFFDWNSATFFESTLNEVANAEREFLIEFEAKGYACMNEYYEKIGIPPTNFGYQLGWFYAENNDPYNAEELEFNYDECTLPDGTKYWLITTSVPPSCDYIF